MKKLIPLFLLLIVWCACKKQKKTPEYVVLEEVMSGDEYDDTPIIKQVITPADSLAVFYIHCTLSKDKTKEREAGNNLVFRYYFKSADFLNSKDEVYHHHIQFEIPNDPQKNYFETSDPKEYHTINDWGCFCDYPDSVEAKINTGKIALKKLNDTTWHVSLRLENKKSSVPMIVDKNFTLYKPQPITYDSDTLNRYDAYGRKQGHWITSNFHVNENGIYRDNYFTGYHSVYSYYNEKKILYVIYRINSNENTEQFYFDTQGQMRKEAY
jgi:hypothetical protein